LENILVKLLIKIDLPTLHRLIGLVILNAIKSQNRGQNESDLAKILISKYRNKIFNEIEIRKAVINSLSRNQIIELSEKCRLASNSNNLYSKVIEYFSKSYNTGKSKILIDFLNLGEEYYYTINEDGRQEKELIYTKHGEIIDAPPFLHPYQKRIKDEIMYRLTQKYEKSFFVQMPTGAGKTLTAQECIVDYFRKPNQLNELKLPEKNKFVVWIVDTNELAEQSFKSFKKLWKARGDKPINAFRLFKNFNPNFTVEDGGIVFAGFDKFFSILNGGSNKQNDSLKYLIRNTSILLVDEAHHSLAETYYHCINAFKETLNIKIIGLSATPGTNSIDVTNSLVELYSNDKIIIRDDKWNVVNNAVDYLQKLDYLAKLSIKALETGVISNEANGNDILIELASNSERNEKILDQIKLANDLNESTLVFACTLDHIYALQILCEAKGIKAKYISGAVEQSERLNIIDEFKTKKFFILINLEILSTGIDLPNVNKIIITRPINSPNLLSQIIGRALRGKENGGNKENSIITVKDNLINYPSASFLYDYFEEAWERI
jgi:DNA repair protein RadD